MSPGRRVSGEEGYRRYHAPRFRFLLELVQRLLPPSATRVLDVGPSPLSALLRKALPCPVDTLGLEPMHTAPEGDHHHADLNRPGALSSNLPRYDLVVFGEVLEHLHTAPAPVLAFLRGLLREHGVLILQTPNAASLPKRVKLLVGRNPYDLIREERDNPGHFREYTLSELLRYARASGYEVEETHRRFYFDARYGRHERGDVLMQPLIGAVKNSVYRALPPALREGITLVLRRARGASGASERVR